MNEIENNQVVQETMIEFENVDKLLQKQELPNLKRRNVSARARFLLQINGLLQQRGNINTALAENEELLEQGNTDPEIYEAIEWQRAEIVRYDTLIQMHKDHGAELGYVLKRNPRTGRFVTASRPDDTEIIPSKKIFEGIDTFFSELINELNEELTEADTELLRMQEEQIQMIKQKDRRMIDTSEQFKKIEAINDRMSQAEKIQQDLILFLHNY